MSLVQSVLSAWRGTSFEQVKQELDATAADIASQQDAGDAGRKRLVELSREFKAGTAAEVRKAVAPLLKSFQAEVDSLSKRAKQAEAAFLSVYQKLIDLPDPAPAFDHLAGMQKRVQRCSDLEIENKQLRDRLTEYNAEFAEVRNQEVTVKQLRERLRELEESVESRVANCVRDRERQLALDYGEKAKQLSSAQLEAAQRLGEAEQRANQLQSALDTARAEAASLRQALDDRQSARTDEFELLAQDAERANERAAQLEKELTAARQRLASQRASPSGGASEAAAAAAADEAGQLRRAELEAQLASRERELAQLADDNRRLQRTADELRESRAQQTAALETQLAETVRRLATAEERLRYQSDYDEIRRELRVLQSVQFAASEEADDSDEVAASASLEERLLRQNGTLQSEAAGLRLRADRLQAEVSRLSGELGEARADCTRQAKLAEQLEEDLRRVKSFSSMFRGAAERERYRARAQELEVAAVAQQQQLGVLRTELDKVRSDNVKLYEKIRFLQSYQAGEQQHQREPESGSGGEFSGYSEAYETRLDPFAKFSRRERERKIAELRPHDKLTLSIGRLILGSRTARAVAFGYTVLLHLLVFLVLFRMAYMETDRRDLSAECQHKFQEHMLRVHGQHNH
uniref:Protein CASP n=1 Tax=Macrostomum lignano TaxID=282301 RepID=A0A1I8G3L9_9PLAT